MLRKVNVGFYTIVQAVNDSECEGKEYSVWVYFNLKDSNKFDQLDEDVIEKAIESIIGLSSKNSLDVFHSFKFLLEHSLP